MCDVLHFVLYLHSMKTHILLSLIFLFGILSGCAEHSSLQDTLDKAETIMEEHPDSAYTLLQTIDSDALRTRGGRARYALLYTQAQDKNYIDEINDSLISLAVDYYSRTDDVRYKFLSYYYKGRVYTNAEDYLNATSYYMEAEQWVDAVADDYLVGLLYAELGRIYRLYYDYPKSLEAYQKSAECYERAWKIRHCNYMWLNMGDVCRNLNDYDESNRLFSLTLHSAKEINDSTLIRISLGSMVMQSIEQKEMKKAESLYRELKLYMDDRHASSALYGRLAQMYSSTGNLVQAWNCMDKGWNRASNCSDSISLYFVSSELYNLTGNEKKAYEELRKGVLLQNKEAHQALQQPILTIQRDYLSEKLKSESYRLYLERLLRILSVLFLSSLLLVVAVVFYRKLKKKKVTIDKLGKEKERVESENRSLLQQLEERKCESDRTIEKLKNEIIRKEKESNAEIAELLKKIGRGESTIESLEEKLMQKEEIRQEMETLVRKLEKDSEANAATICGLRVELEAMQDEGRKTTLQKVDLLRYDLEHVVELVFLHEEQWPNNNTKEKRIRNKISLLKKAYFAGEDEYGKVEDLVNRYLDNVMVHFRKEVCLSSEADYRRVCYMFAGVSGLSIARIMGESKETVYQRRSRLLKKIATLSCNHKEIFILLLSK